MTDAPTPRVPRRNQWLVVAFVVFVVVMTLANAAANLIPGHFPSARELARVEQDEVAATRKARIAELRSTADHCDAPRARELARALVYDGQSAIAYVDDYERRCGEDPIMTRWRAASRLHHASRTSAASIASPLPLNSMVHDVK